MEFVVAVVAAVRAVGGGRDDLGELERRVGIVHVGEIVVGAVGGAVVGGNPVAGAVIGGAVGAAAGALTDRADIDLGNPIWR